MYDELKLALVNAVSPEQLWVMEETHRVLTSVGLTDFDDELQQVIGMADGLSDNYMFVSRVNDIFIYAVGDSLRQYGVTVVDETPLYVMTGMLEALANIEHYVIPETLRDMTLADEDADVVLASIIPLFTWVDEPECLEYLEHVRPDTIKRIAEIAENNILVSGEVEVPHPDLNRKIKAINQLGRLQQTEQSLVVASLAKSGFALCGSIESILAATIEDIDRLNAERAGIELLGVVLMSDTPYNDTKATLHDLVVDYVDNPRDQSHMEQSAAFYMTALELPNEKA